MNLQHQQNIRAQRLVVVTSLVLFAAKLYAWYITDSVAVLSDALESIVNVVSGFFGLYSLYLSSLPKDKNHPYGHGKVEFLSAGVEGIMISIAGFIIIYKSILGLQNMHTPQSLNFGLWIITGSAIVNFFIGRIALINGKKNNSLALIASGKHLQTDTISTLGIVVGLLVFKFTGWFWVDPAVAIVLAFVIIYHGFKIVRQSVAGIMDESDSTLLIEMVAYLNKNRSENWVDLHNLRIIKYGSVLHLDCHLTVPWYLNVHEAHDEVDRLQHLLQSQYGDSVELFVHTDGCLDFSCRICDKQNCGVRQHPFEKRMEWNMDLISSNSKHRIPAAQ